MADNTAYHFGVPKYGKADNIDASISLDAHQVGKAILLDAVDPYCDLAQDRAHAPCGAQSLATPAAHV